MNRISLFRPLAWSCAALLVNVAFPSFAASITQQEYDAIAERIKPIGQVNLASSSPSQASNHQIRDGESVYQTYCKACHSTGAGGAPITGDVKAWRPRIAQGLDQLNAHAIAGFNGMPPRGMCMDCSDDEIAAAIKQMIQGIE